MKESLPLLTPFFLKERAVAEGWKMRYASLEEGKKNGYHKPNFNDSEWEPAQVPKLYRATFGKDTIWYRTSLPTWLVKQGRRLMLKFEGSWLITDVWLNGKYLGGHYGYFAPFGFDITDLVREKGENVLAVCVQSQPESELRKKKHVMGVFNDWDCKPYSNMIIGALPKDFEWYVPVGMWRTVSLGESGAAIIEHIKASPKILSKKEAIIEFDVRLKNLTAKRLKSKLRIQISPHNFQSKTAPVETTFKTEIPPKETVDAKFSLVLKDPEFWWCWTRGKPNLYVATVKIEQDGMLSAESKVLFGIREVKANVSKGKWEWFLNGRKIFPKGSNYISNFMLDRSNKELYAKDLNLLKGANMDFVRVHAHIEKEEFYTEADERGMLVMCDFPLIFCYVYEVAQEDVKFFEEAVKSQIPEMVNLLYNHPSIVIWEVHNEPPWLPFMSLMMGIKPGTNKTINLEAKEMVAKLDSTRPVIAASGDMDEHLYYGWYMGKWQDFRREISGFPTEFGAQSLPNKDSDFWKHVKTKPWPINDDEPTWLYADYQLGMWANFGVGAPKDFKTLEEYIAEGQKYQAFLCKFAAERFRTLKFNPTGGMVHFMFVDCHPAITWSVVDYYRNPKLAYWAMKQAYNPTHVCIDLDGDYKKYRYSALFQAGGQFKAPLHVVNDNLEAPKEAVLRWSIVSLEGKEILSGSKRVRIPTCDEGALKCHEILWNIPSTEKGVFKLGLKLLTDEGEEIDANEVEFFVGQVEDIKE